MKKNRCTIRVASILLTKMSEKRFNHMTIGENMLEFHWHEDYGYSPVRLPVGHSCSTTPGYLAASKAIKQRLACIHSDQSAFLSTKLLDSGYRIFLHFASGDVAEIKYGVNGVSGRCIKPGTNIEKLTLAGEFGQLSYESR